MALPATPGRRPPRGHIQIRRSCSGCGKSVTLDVPADEIDDEGAVLCAACCERDPGGWGTFTGPPGDE